MIKRLRALLDWFNKREARERLGIAVGAIIVTGFLWNLIVNSSLENSTKSLAIQTEQAQAKKQVIEADIKLVNLNLKKKGQQNVLNQSANQFQQRLSMMIQNAATPAMFAKIVNDMLAKQQDVKILTVKNLPVEAWMPEGTSNAKFPGDIKTLYKHGIEIQFQGSYFKTLDFLVYLEKLPWRFYCESLSYTTLQYPLADVKVKFYILSTQSG